GRHVSFVERPAALRGDDDRAFSWLMMSDVCKHCQRAGCLENCPTGAIVRTEFDTVYVQPDICNGCGYCIAGCPFGVIDRREDDGRAWKCTMCYDRLKGDMEPACAKACPTDSIQFGDLDRLGWMRGRNGGGEGRSVDPAVGILEGEGSQQAGAGSRAGSEGSAPCDVWAYAPAGAGEAPGGVPHREPTYYDRPVLKRPVWIWAVPAYFYAGGAAGAAAVLGAATQAFGGDGTDGLVRRCRWVAAVSGAAGTGLLIHDLGRPER